MRLRFCSNPRSLVQPYPQDLAAADPLWEGTRVARLEEQLRVRSAALPSPYPHSTQPPTHAPPTLYPCPLPARSARRA